jgi:peptidoglycan-associated lipoprotein
MKTGTVLVFLACLVEAGCSHAKPKTASAQALTPRRPVAGQPRMATSDQTQSESKASDGTAAHSIFFTFDSAAIASGARPMLDQVAAEARKSGGSVRIEGNCDERGTTEYNLALGDRRARVAAEYLQRMGVSPRQIQPVTYGSERPKNPGHDDEAWAVNRRDDFVLR